jgi:hypothetical protein
MWWQVCHFNSMMTLLRSGLYVVGKKKYLTLAGFELRISSARGVVAISTTVYSICVEGIYFMIRWQNIFEGTCCCTHVMDSGFIQNVYINLIIYIMMSNPQQSVS